jgi:hypothetical protein
MATTSPLLRATKITATSTMRTSTSPMMTTSTPLADAVDETLKEGDDEYETISAAPMQACPESQRPSVPSR